MMVDIGECRLGNFRKPQLFTKSTPEKNFSQNSFTRLELGDTFFEIAVLLAAKSTCLVQSTEHRFSARKIIFQKQ
jgi:hypothetical protein